MPEWRTYFPPIGGFRFGLFTVLPDSAAAPDSGGHGSGGQRT